MSFEKIVSKIKDVVTDDNLSKDEKLSDILKFLFVDISEIDQNKYYILGSYGIRKHRKINDLDINIDQEEFLKLEKLVKNNVGNIEFYNHQIRYVLDLTEIYNTLTSSEEKDFSLEAFQKSPDVGYPDNTFSLNYLGQTKSFDIDNNRHQFFNLETLLRWKKIMNREKDKPDIELIEKLLSGQSRTKKVPKKIKLRKRNSK